MEKVKLQIPVGTKEWATSNVNLLFGCSHNCKYCYAKKIAIRFGRKDENTWKAMKLNKSKLNYNYKKRKGRIMFPSSHDLVPEYRNECFLVLEKLLNSDNSVLITSKPHFNVIKELCDRFKKFKELIQFRFTITSTNNKILKFWEEGAPLFEERLSSLKYAFIMRFKTSVSIEPFLDKNPIFLIEKIYPYVSETIWIGKMNYICRDPPNPDDLYYFKKVRKNYAVSNIQNIINKLSKNKKIRYKDSIKRMNVRIPKFQAPSVKNL